MKYVTSVALGLMLAVALAAPKAEAATTSASLLSQIQYLKQQLAELEQQLRAGQSTLPSNCYTDRYGNRYCTSAAPQHFYSNANDIDSIEVDFVGRVAQVRVEYDRGDDEFFAVEADTESEVAALLEPELNLPAATILRLMDEVSGSRGHSRRNNNDIDDITVTWRGNDADVRVRFEDNDTDRFTLRNVDRDRNDVIGELADRYDVDDNDIEDVIDFNGSSGNRDDIRDIRVNFHGDDADVTVHFDNGSTQRFTLSNVDDDEDEVISRLADRYDMSERDIEDIIDFN
jgi:hypothetical protein